LKFQGVVYRAHNPKWAYSPTSGEGARIKGGRFNPKGVAALYTSLSVATCGLEMGHGFEALFSALTICSYEADVEDVIDLTTPKGRREAKTTLEDLGCAWIADIHAGIRPASWTIAERIRASGASGILVPSFANGARRSDKNLVLWKWSESPPYRVVVYDPENVLRN
jgi:RES domain-containing protein